MVEWSGLSVRLGKNQILREISGCAKDGEITVLLGKNGSGKTTLLRTLCGVQTKYTGNIAVNGKQLSAYAAKELASVNGLMPQILPRPAISVELLVSCGRHPYTGLSGALSDADRAETDRALEESSLTALRKRLVCHLSGGERQMAYFAMLSAQGTQNLFLDEPSASLDTVYRKQLFAALRAEREKGKCVLLCIHDLEEAYALADRILVLDRGSCVFSGTPDAFAESTFPEQLFRQRFARATGENGEELRLFRDINQ